jgi:hypothetical protein
MSKFLEGIENHTPTDIESKADMDARLEFSRTIVGNKQLGIIVNWKHRQGRDIAFITLPSKKIMELEFINVTDKAPAPAVEDNQTGDIQKAAKTAAAVLAIPDQGIGKQLLNPAARKVQMAKRTLADKLKKAADNIQF